MSPSPEPNHYVIRAPYVERDASPREVAERLTQRGYGGIVAASLARLESGAGLTPWGVELKGALDSERGLASP